MDFTFVMLSLAAAIVIVAWLTSLFVGK